MFTVPKLIITLDLALEYLSTVSSSHGSIVNLMPERLAHILVIIFPGLIFDLESVFLCLSSPFLAGTLNWILEHLALKHSSTSLGACCSNFSNLSIVFC